MRLFLALDLDDEARAAIAAEQTRIARALGRRSSLKFVKPEQLHLTLVFLGNVDEPCARGVIAAVDAPVDQPAFDAVFDGVGLFPPRGAPRVLWIGVIEGAREMIALQQRLAARMDAVGVALEARTFQPHLTLARWRDARPSDRTALRDVPPVPVHARVRIDHVTLYQSRLSPAGSTYTPLARATLSPPAEPGRH
jgi:RNA 2',3'-cyclic 3'-phosphodiesterase